MNKNMGDAAMSMMTYLLSAIFIMAGLSKVGVPDLYVGLFKDFGLSPIFINDLDLTPIFVPIIGVIEMLGAMLIVTKSGRSLGSLMLVFIMSAAATTHLLTGVGMMALPMITILVVMATVIACVQDKQDKPS